MRRLSLMTLAALLVFGCGGANRESPPAIAAAPADEPETQPEPEGAASPLHAPADAAPADAQTASTGTAAPAAPDPNAPRDVRYVLTQEGLRVDVLDVRFFVQTKAVRTQAGIVVKVMVEATASEPRSLLSPKHGPLAFAGKVKRAGKSEPEPFGDSRQGDSELPLAAGSSVKFTREWPDKGQRALGNGDVLELDVGLWGLGHDASDRRAVKQFAHVKARVDKWNGSARVEPPPHLVGK